LLLKAFALDHVAEPSARVDADAHVECFVEMLQSGMDDAHIVVPSAARGGAQGLQALLGACHCRRIVLQEHNIALGEQESDRETEMTTSTTKVRHHWSKWRS
jgi:hypothetical protein